MASMPHNLLLRLHGSFPLLRLANLQASTFPLLFVSTAVFICWSTLPKVCFLLQTLSPSHPEPGNRQASLPCHWGYGEFFWPLSLYVQTFEHPALNRILNINSPLTRHKRYLLTLYGQNTSPASTSGVFMDLNGPRKWCSTRFFIHPAPRFPHTFWCTGASLSSYLSIVSNFHFTFSSTRGLPSW